MTAEEYDAQWTCDWCKQWWVVPGLARACEEKHLREAVDAA